MTDTNEMILIIDNEPVSIQELIKLYEQKKRNRECARKIMLKKYAINKAEELGMTVEDYAKLKKVGRPPKNITITV